MSKWSVLCPDRSAERPVHPDNVQRVPEQKAETVFSGLCAGRVDMVRRLSGTNVASHKQSTREIFIFPYDTNTHLIMEVQNEKNQTFCPS